MKKYFIVVITTFLGSYAFAQVAVRDEPRHHNVFENDYVRVLDVWVAPKDTTQFHVHATPSVFIMLSKTTTSAQLAGPAAGKKHICCRKFMVRQPGYPTDSPGME
jgi:hypothetical protein